MDKQIIIGLHSIAAALNNPEREILRVVATEEGLDELNKKHKIPKSKLPNLELVSGHLLQEKAKKLIQELDFEFQRIPSGIFLEATPLEEINSSFLFEKIESRMPVKILCLDQVTDAHNGAAILRTASFYGLDAVVVSVKGNFGSSPAFTRIASGALEFLPIIQVSSLVKFITKLNDLGVETIGFSEHSETELGPTQNSSVCLIMGAEDVGLSHAVSRIIAKTVALKSKGKIKSLNVSVATAVALEKIFG